MKKRTNWLSTPVKIGIAVLLIVTVFLSSFAIMQAMQPLADSAQGSSKYPQNITDQLERTCQTAENGEERWCYVYQLPEDIRTDQVLFFVCYWCSYRVYAGDTEIASYADPQAQQGVRVHWIPLPSNAAGKQLRIESYGWDWADTLKKGVYLGSTKEMLLYLIKDNMYVIFAVFFALIASFTIGTSAALIWKKRGFQASKGLWGLTAFLLISGFWVLSDSYVLQLFTRQTGLIMLLSYLSFMCMPIGLLYFVNMMAVQHRRYLDLLCVLHILVLLLFLVIYNFELLPMYYGLVPVHILIVADLILLLYCCQKELRRFRNPVMKDILFGVGGLSVCSIAALISYLAGVMDIYAVFYSVGLLAFSIFMAIAGCHRIYLEIEQNAGVEAYQKMAYTDSLTGLRNRRAFEETTQMEEKHGYSNTAYLMMDVNGLKEVNDNLGHAAGDRLLQTAANCISETFRGFGSFFRIGGDEFAVILWDIRENELIQLLNEFHLLLDMAEKEQNFPVNVAVGYAMRRNKSTPAKELLAAADVQMYQDKQEYKRRQSEV